MLDLDHIAITVDNLETSIYFYTKFGYKLTAKFEDDGYRWATLKLNNHSLMCVSYQIHFGIRSFVISQEMIKKYMN